ncbi:MAG: calcium/sodium antiporter [Bacteroidales bacterium]|nr:calcium/sodium antiporter [Bacteroidales bacterium]
MTIILMLVGLVLLVKGADWLVEGASFFARKAGVSEFVIGLTIVGFGTSCPELVVSLTGAFEGNADISVGNVIGSNIFNTLFILGVTSLLFPVSMKKINRNRDIPAYLATCAIVLDMGMGGLLLGKADGEDIISTGEGIIMLLIFAVYLVFCFKTDSAQETDGAASQIKENRSTAVSVAMIAAGLGCLIFGGDLLVDNAVLLAKSMGVSDKFIAVTILAGGTSLPELATSIAAALKKQEQLALGNIMGSNIFNALFILGSAAVVTPLSFSSMDAVDAGVLILSAVLLLIWTFTGKKNRIDRWEGGVMLLCFIAYYVYIFNKL